MQTDPHRITWDTYSSAWSQTDPHARAALLGRCLAPDAAYADPTMQAAGHAQLSAYMAAVQGGVPELRFVITDFKSHHNHSLAHWNMVNGQGRVLTPGISHGWYGEDGKLMQMTGFFGAISAPGA
jgi:hypothetical protein